MGWVLVLLVFGVLWLCSAGGLLDGAFTQYIRLNEAIFFSLAFWLVLLAAMRRVWIVLVVSFPAVLLAPMEIWLRSEFGAPTSAQSMALALETSWSEIANFLVAYGMTLAVFFLTWLVLYGSAVWLAYKYRLVWKHRSYFWCLSILPCIVLFFYVSAGMPPWTGAVESVDPFDGKVAQGWSQKWADIFPVNILIALQHYELEKTKTQHTQNALQHQSMHGTLLKPADAPDVVVLVVGESSTATRWSLLGYPRITTPRLAAQANLVAFTDVVGLSVATRSAVPGVLSRRPVLRPEGSVDVNAEPSLIKAFGEAGYQTHWFSNQSPFGKFDTSIAVYAREAQDVRFLNPSSFEFQGSFDEILLNPLRSTLKTPGKHFIVLHTLGSHFDYSMRYPDRFDGFTPSLKNASLNGLGKDEKKERIGNSYDNSILYTDYFLSEVVAAINQQGSLALMAYFSDHGVDVPNEKCTYMETARRGASAFQVPALFWFSDAMRKVNSAEWDKLVENKSLPYTTRAMFSTLLQLAGVGISGDLPRENFLQHPDLARNSRNIAVGSQLVNFDAARLRNSCVISAH